MNAHDYLVTLLYEGVSATPPFGDFLSALADAVHADSATILVDRRRRDRVGGIFSSQVPSSRKAGYSAMFRQDPFVDLKLGQAATIAEHLGDNAEQAPFMQRFMIPHGVFHVLGLDEIEPGGTRVRLRATRPLGKCDYSENDKVVFNDLGPHLIQAIGLFLRIGGLEAEREAYAAALTRLSMGAILVAQDGSTMRTTAGAQHLLDKGDPLKVIGGRLSVAREKVKRAELANAIAAMADPDIAADAVHAMSLENETGSIFSILVRPASFAGSLSSPLSGASLVLIADTTPKVAPSAAVLIKLFGLTRSEAELAALLTQGLSLDDVAATLGVTKNTAKAHLRAIFSKTGATRQSMLVRLILRSVDELK